MADTFKFEMTGVAESIKSLRLLPDKVEKKSMRAATRSAMAVVLKAVKRHAPVLLGILKKALTVKVKYYPKTGVTYGIVGPKSSYSETRVSSVKKGTFKKHKPSKYSHLQEFGTKDAPPNPFMRRAWAETKESSLKAFTDSLARSVEREVKAAAAEAGAK